MTECEHIVDTILHKKYVLESSLILIQYLYNNNRPEDALNLAKRCARHDNSKLEGDEIAEFMKLDKTKKSMTDSTAEITDDIKKVIEKHWKNNRHHPEHFRNYTEMSELDVMEMVCDWYSRSKQFGTDFISFVLTRQENRFKFPEDFFDNVYKYCKIIAENDFKGDKN